MPKTSDEARGFAAYLRGLAVAETKESERLMLNNRASVMEHLAHILDVQEWERWA